MLFIRRNRYTLITFAIVSIILTLYFFNIINISAFLGLIGSTLAFYIGLLKQKSDDDQVFKELFQSFNSRYDEYNDLINECDRDNKKQLKDPEDVDQIIDYLNLCAEEYLWYKRGRIPNDVWTAWKKGILHNIDIPQINTIYNRERRQNESYYGLFTELEKK